MSYATQDFSPTYREQLNAARLAFPDRAMLGFVAGVVVAAVLLLGFKVLTDLPPRPAQTVEVAAR